MLADLQTDNYLGVFSSSALFLHFEIPDMM